MGRRAGGQDPSTLRKDGPGWAHRASALTLPTLRKCYGHPFLVISLLGKKQRFFRKRVIYWCFWWQQESLSGESNFHRVQIGHYRKHLQWSTTLGIYLVQVRDKKVSLQKHLHQSTDGRRESLPFWNTSTTVLVKDEGDCLEKCLRKVWRDDEACS